MSGWKISSTRQAHTVEVCKEQTGRKRKGTVQRGERVLLLYAEDKGRRTVSSGRARKQPRARPAIKIVRLFMRQRALLRLPVYNRNPFALHSLHARRAHIRHGRFSREHKKVDGA